jgi:lysophospholipase L1-like esterase
MDAPMPDRSVSDETIRAREQPDGAPFRLLPALGFVAVVAIALAWSDLVPGGHFLRSFADSDVARSERELARHASERLRRFALENERVVPNAIVFVGSSTIERFPLDRYFPEKPCLNRGILSASAPMLERFLDPLLPPAPMKGIVLYAGSIDLREPGSTLDERLADEVASRISSLLDAVRRRDPAVPVAVIGVLPTRSITAAQIRALVRLNSRLAESARERGFAFVNTARAPITSPSGSLAEEYSADEMHLDERGYRILSGWIVEDGGDIGRRLAP